MKKTIDLPRTTPIQIICGDCAGDDDLPVLTSLNTNGRCARCGGGSYMVVNVDTRSVEKGDKS